MAEAYSGEFYCVKCKSKREASGNVVVNESRRLAKAKCPECGTNLTRPTQGLTRQQREGAAGSGRSAFSIRGRLCAHGVVPMVRTGPGVAL